MIEERVEEAADTLRRLPEPRFQTCRSTWPPVLREFWEMYGAEPARLRPGPPSAVAIDRMDQTLEWLRWLEPEESRLLWWRATRMPWKVIEKKLGVSRQTAWRQWTYALIKIASLLNGRSRKNVATKNRVTKHPERGISAM